VRARTNALRRGRSGQGCTLTNSLADACRNLLNGPVERVAHGKNHMFDLRLVYGDRAIDGDGILVEHLAPLEHESS
jgi:hypothetical protein